MTNPVPDVAPGQTLCTTILIYLIIKKLLHFVLKFGLVTLPLYDFVRIDFNIDLLSSQ